MTTTSSRRAARTLWDATDTRTFGEQQVGGKAFSLARLEEACERVPEWTVIPANVLDLHLRDAAIFDVVKRALAAMAAGAASDREARSRTAAMLQSLVDALVIDPGLVKELEVVASRLGEPLAVRSSAVGEDGERFSFAGQFDTLLDVRRDDLADAVRRCWRSAFSAHALEYRRRAGTLHDATRLAVIVQRQIEGETSGVLFTVDPLSGDRTRTRISACRGMGAALVSGETDADEYLIAADGAELGACRIAREQRLLTPAQLSELAALGQRLSRGQDAPRDIEWTIAGGELWVLQDRAVTSAAPREETENRIVWDNSNIQESYCGVTTPLTFSFARAAYASVYEQTMRALRVPDATIAEHRPMLGNLLGLLHGRVYYNLNNWYRGLLLLPAFRRNKEDMERMMGVEEPVDFVRDERLTRGAQLRRLPALARTYVLLMHSFATLERDAERFLAKFDARLQTIDRRSLHRRTLAELMGLLELLRAECLERWSTPIINDFQVMMSVGRLRRLVARTPGRTDDIDLVLQTLLGGAAVAVSAGPAMLMLRLAEIARGSAAIMTALNERQPDVALSNGSAASAEFASVLGELLERYGDRCMGELKLESRALRDDPAFVVQMLRNYLDGHASRPEELAAVARAHRERVEGEIGAHLGVLGRRRFRRALSAARQGIARRETLRLARTRLFGVHRDVYRAIGARLTERGDLERSDDIFFLTTDEIRGCWNGTGASADLALLARERRTEFSEYEKLAPPNRIVTTGAPHEALRRLAQLAALATTPVNGSRMLRGLGCSAGIAEGIVRIVRSPSDDLALDGHILVALRTDPGWAPLFPSARAIIVERGSLLSHSAVLARELGLPAVVGFPGILDTLRDGERVRVDGGAGTIERLEMP
jgi:phosphohistidine swiveling domain-containing protein